MILVLEREKLGGIWLDGQEDRLELFICLHHDIFE
jgi:hypothetical protein